MSDSGPVAPSGDGTAGHEAMIAKLQTQIADLEGKLRRVDVLEMNFRNMQRHSDLERDRLDWALGAIAGMEAEIANYHSARRTDEYRAVFATDNPLVSVCIATMDRADLLLGRCLPSIIQQTYQNIEIIVVGDNCIDDTEDRLAGLRDNRIRFYNLNERGPYPRSIFDRWRVAGSNAMNHALSLCTGHFITHIDDDDTMVPHRIETLTTAAMADKADFLWHPLWFQERDGTFTTRGNGRLELRQVSTGSIFYHRYFARIPWDVFCYRLQEPGDWNRIRRIKMLRPRLLYIDEPLFHHYREGRQPPLVPRPGERFLD